MKALIAVDSCYLDWPVGMPRFAWDTAHALRQRGWEVSMVSGHHDGTTKPTLEEHSGLRILRYPRPNLPGWHPSRLQQSVELVVDALRTHFADESFDLVHGHAPVSGVGAARFVGPNTRRVYTMHSPATMENKINWSSQGWTGRIKLLFGMGPLRRLEREALDTADDVHTLSQFTRQCIGEIHGLADKVTVVPYWRRPELERTMTKAEAREKLGWPQDETIVYTLRRHAPRYGIDVAIRAVAPLAKAGRCRFVAAGDGALRGQFQQLAQELGAADHINFPGRISDEEVAWGYQAADLFILPTRALECFGLITLEALSYGCPVLSTDAAAIPETVRPILPEFIVPAGDEVALRQKVTAFLDGALVPPSEAELIRYVHENYDADVVLPKLVTLLTKDIETGAETGVGHEAADG